MEIASKTEQFPESRRRVLPGDLIARRAYDREVLAAVKPQAAVAMRQALAALSAPETSTPALEEQAKTTLRAVRLLWEAAARATETS